MRINISEKMQRPTGTILELIFAEHMEEDDPTLRTLPRWVELEYKVSINSMQHLPSSPLPTPGLTMSTNVADPVPVLGPSYAKLINRIPYPPLQPFL